MTTISTEEHKTVKIKFNNTTRNFMLIFGSANQSPYLGIEDLRGIQEISNTSKVVNIQRDAEQSDLYIITCPAWSTFFYNRRRKLFKRCRHIVFININWSDCNALTIEIAIGIYGGQ